ncbi:MAG TPA: ribonuclease Z [Anaeromyxobacteraceae bacterium]|nr:ribonuclease Z [Anaeromyxobacteraceae bacterium]
MLRLTFLGTSAAQPTSGRNLSSIAIRRERELFLVDCGEGTQRQMIRYATGFDVAAICFTHLHLDHWLGVVGFLRTLSMQGRPEPLDLYGPRGLARIVDRYVAGGIEQLSFDLRVQEVAAGQKIRRDGSELVPFATRHGIPSVGWALVEDGRPGRFHPDRATALGVEEGPMFGALQRGKPVTLPDGRVIRPEEVVDPPRPGRKVVVTGDTRPCPTTVEAARGADLLVHESTFGDPEAERALETDHSTAREAGRIAREAGVARLVLTHLSTRYDREPEALLAQAREEFGEVAVAHDGLTLDVPLAG